MLKRSGALQFGQVSEVLPMRLTPELSRAAKRLRLERIVRPQQPKNRPTVALPKDYQRNGPKVTTVPQRLNGPYPEPVARGVTEAVTPPLRGADRSKHAISVVISGEA